MDVSTDYLKTFIAVCECRSFTFATAKVHKSQAAISVQIAKLEEQAGSRLIDRSNHQFKLTKEGEFFLDFARAIVDRTNAAAQALEALHYQLASEVRIGTTRSVGSYLLPDVLSHIAKQLPELRISVLTQGRTPTYERLKKGELDLAVVLTDVAPRGLFSKPLRAEPLCFIISPLHPLAKEKAVSEEELVRVPFIAGVAGNDFSEMLEDLFDRKGIFEAARRITINDLRARKEAVRAGVGFTVVPQFAVTEDVRNNTLKILQVKGGRLPETKLMMIEGRRHTPAYLGAVKHAFVEKLARTLTTPRRSG